MPFTVWGLALAQALLTTGNILLVSVAALIGKQLASHPALITLPIALQFTGTIFATMPAAYLMQRFGRKFGFVLGNLVGIAGAVVALMGLQAESLMGFGLGTFLIGIAVGTAQQYRFAATDAAPVEHRPRAISMVMAGGIVAAILGPNLAIWAQSWAPENEFIGAFYGLLALYVLALLVIFWLPLAKPVAQQQVKQGRSYGELFKQPVLVGAVLSGMIGYGVMVLLMSATPVAMDDLNYSFPAIASVIQWHVLGMFAPSFFTGNLIRRFTSRNVILWGCGLLILSAMVNMFGVTYWHYLTSMLLLGVGWNFTFIGATHLLTFTYLPEEQGRVQGMNEFLVFSAAAVGSLFAGQGVAWLGWGWLNAFAIVLVMMVFAVIWRLRDPAKEAHSAS